MALIDKASLLMVPSTYEDGTLYNVLPSGNKAPDETGNHNGYDQTRADFTFSRGSNLAATRINSDGLIEKGRENLLLQSNQFDTTWVLQSGAGASVTSGQNGYDGTNNAWELDITYNGGDGYLRQEKSISGVNTFSIYAKKNSADGIYIEFAAGNYPNIKVDLTDGSLISTNGTIDTNIESVGNGWYRISFSVNQSLARVNIRIVNGSGTNTTGTIYIQNAQLEKGLVATDYIETGSTTAQAGILEDMPRINYDANGENGALLLEPSRTNLVTYSEYFEHSLWDSGATTAEISKSPNLSPEGVANCYYVENVSGGQLGFYTTITSGASYTGSFWVRKVSGSGVVRMINVNNSGTDFNVGTEWTRVSVTATSTSTTGRCYVQAKNTGDIIEVYGAQLEAGSYASSYVPTYGSAVTRSADDCSVTGVSDVIGQSEGTLFIDAVIADEVDTEGYYFRIDETSYSNTILFGRSASGNVFAILRVGGSTVSQMAENDIPDRVKLAFAYKSGDSVLYMNGSEADTDSATFTITADLNDFRLGSYSSSLAHMSGDVKQAAIFKERLSDSELATLTTL